MNYGVSDSSGTDDDLQPAHQNRFGRGGRVSSDGRSMVAGGGCGVPRPPLRRMQSDMETQIHLIEQEAYSSVLRAFRAQSDALTWEKQEFITELRKELNVSDEEHREILSRVNGDEMIRRIRERRQTNGMQPGMFAAPQHVSASRKKQKVSQSVVVPSPTMQQSVLPTSNSERGPLNGGRSKKTKSMPSSDITGRVQGSSHGSLGGFVANGPGKIANRDPLVGRKVCIRWPEDNTFYEAVITDYNPVEGVHALVYGMHTPDEALEWVNLKQIPPEDIKWEGENPGTSQRGGLVGAGRGTKRGPNGDGPGRGREALKGQSKKETFVSQNVVGRKASGDIELLHTDTLIKEVEKIFNGTHPDPIELEKAKQVLKEHELALLKAIAIIEEASNGERDGERPFLQDRAMDQEQGWWKRQFNEMSGEGRGTEGFNGDNTVF